MFVSLLIAASAAFAQEPAQQPEDAGTWTVKKAVHAKRYMVAAANPLAAKAGLEMLDRGGSAIDAMIATQLVLGLVEPQSSGLGGGAYLMHFEARRKRLTALDARESAPAGATPALFMRDGHPMEWHRARSGGWAVGVPGVPRLLEVAHARWGRLEWATLFEPAIALADKGFRISPRLSRLAGGAGIAEEARARGYLLASDGKPKSAGTLLRNPEYARTLRELAAHGADSFYSGELAEGIVAAVRGHRHPGSLAMEDLASYRVRDIDPVCAVYRAYRVCGPGPSTYGGVGTLQVLGALARFDMASTHPGTSEAVHLISEAERLAFADRARYGADDRFVAVPARALVEPSYLASRSALIEAHRSMRHARAGEPRGASAAFADDLSDEAVGTSHLAIVDRDGDVVSMTTSVEGDFGTRIMADGFFLNNTLTDFNFDSLEDGRPVANSVGAGKRPRSSMAPMIVLDAASGDFEMAIGSPGGSLIIDYVAKVLVAALDWNLDLQAAVDLPNFGSRNGPTEIEKGTALESIAPSLAAMGHDVRVIDMTSGLHGIRRAANGWQGAADPRREGVALGR
ncbi:MAG: gamma-glutamyltransferase family protein [Usitatibacter sp.]